MPQKGLISTQNATVYMSASKNSCVTPDPGAAAVVEKQKWLKNVLRAAGGLTAAFTCLMLHVSQEATLKLLMVEYMVKGVTINTFWQHCESPSVNYAYCCSNHFNDGGCCHK